MENNNTEPLVCKDSPEKVLKESFDTFFECSLTPLVLLDSEFNFVSVNKAYANGCNRDIHDFVGANHFDLYPNAENQKIFEDVVRTAIPYRVQAKPFMYQDRPQLGVTYWDWTLNPILSDEGKVAFLVFSLVDVTDLRVAQIKLAESEKKYRTLVENANSIILQRKIDGQITFFNEYAQKFFGFSEDEIIGRNIVGTIVPPKDTSGRDLQAMIDCINKKPDRFKINENENICKDGRRVWVSWTNKPIRDENGRVVEILAVGTDISKRKQDESIIKVTNTLLGLFIRRTSRKEYLDCVCRTIREWSRFNCVGIRILQDDGSTPFKAWVGFSDDFIGKMSLFPIINFNPANYHYGGYNSSVAAAIKYRKKILGMIHLADHEPGLTNERLEEFLETVAALVAEALYRFEVESRLNESNELLKTVVSGAPVVLFAVDKNGIFTFAEGSKFIDIKINPNDLIGKNVFEYYAGQEDVLESIRQAMAGTPRISRITSFEGFIFDVNYSQIKDSNGRMVGVIGVANDVTEAFEAEKKVSEYQKRLRSLTAALVVAEEQERRRIAEELHDSFGPILSHSIRELGKIEKSIKGKSAQSLHEIHQYLKDAIARTRDMTFNLSPPSLHIFGLEFAIEELAEKFSKANSIEYDYYCSDEQKQTNKETQILLFRSVHEVLANVAKHSNADKVKIEIGVQGENIRIRIEDNGLGFNVSQLTDPDKYSTGFGIFSIRERLTHIGGDIEINSVIGIGTEVILTAPLDAMSTQTAAGKGDMQ